MIPAKITFKMNQLSPSGKRNYKSAVTLLGRDEAQIMLRKWWKNGKYNYFCLEAIHSMEQL